MSNLSAALGLAQLENLKEFLKFKRKLYNKYRQAFKSFKKGRIFKEPKNSKSNYWLQTLILDKKYSSSLIAYHMDRKHDFLTVNNLNFYISVF